MKFQNASYNTYNVFIKVSYECWNISANHVSSRIIPIIPVPVSNVICELYISNVKSERLIDRDSIE